MGQLNVLNVAAGDMTISFDTKDAAEAIRAKRIIEDMLKRGYALLVKDTDGAFVRALGFDAEKGEYIIADFAPTETEIKQKGNENYEQTEEPKKEETQSNTWIQKGSEQPKPKRGRQKRVGMETTTTFAVARSAGG